MMMKNLSYLFVSLFLLFSCSVPQGNKKGNTVVGDPLSQWNEGGVKNQINNFIQRDTNDIPVEDRIAVFDMDGTIACESPLWFEMYCAVAKLNADAEKDPSLLKYPEYQFARVLAENPADSTVHADWVSSKGNFIDSMVWKAFVGSYHEDYVNYCNQYLTTAINTDKQIILGDMFYEPMLQLIKYLQANYYQVYIVSGSVQGVIWSIVPEKTTLNKRQQLVGTRQVLTTEYNNGKTQFVINKGIFDPKNNNEGKAENIYAKLGKTPVFAFGNTTGDFAMLHYAITNPHKGVGFMLNHDDTREYVYPPYHGPAEPDWEQKLNDFGGVVVSMKDDFKSVWKK
jgi:phosphoserine phosphatase